MSVRRAGISSSRETQLPVKGESVAEAEVAYLFVVGFPYAAVAGGQGKIVEEFSPSLMRKQYGENFENYVIDIMSRKQI